MPRIAASLATLLTMAVCIGFNTIRYPVVWEMVAHIGPLPQTVDTSETQLAARSAEGLDLSQPASRAGERDYCINEPKVPPTAHGLSHFDPIPEPTVSDTRPKTLPIVASIGGPSREIARKRQIDNNNGPLQRDARNEEPGAWALPPKPREDVISQEEPKTLDAMLAEEDTLVPGEEVSGTRFRPLVPVKPWDDSPVVDTREPDPPRSQPPSNSLVELLPPLDQEWAPPPRAKPIRPPESPIPIYPTTQVD